jgi:hypothetical protein
VRLKAAAVVGANVTLIVQVAATARAAPQVPPAPPAGRAKGCGVPPPKVNVPPASAWLPVLVTVNVSALLVVPVAQLPNAKGLGDTLAVKVAAIPVPLNVTGEPFTVALPVMVAVPFTAPGAVGVNTMSIVHVAPAARVAAHVPPAAPAGRENGAVTTTAVPVKFDPPVLCNVST